MTLNFYIEEVAETLHQFAEIADRHGNVQVTKKFLHELANKLVGGHPLPVWLVRRTDEDAIYRRLELIQIGRNGFWFKTTTIDYSVWMNLYDMGWREPRWPLPVIIEVAP